MSASYIRREPLVSNPCLLPLLSPGSMNTSELNHISSPSTNNRSIPDRLSNSKQSPHSQSGPLAPPPPSHHHTHHHHHHPGQSSSLQSHLRQPPYNPNLHSPNMSPDSTLTQLSASSTSFVSYLSSSTGFGFTPSGNPVTCDSFLRSALLSDAAALDKQPCLPNSGANLHNPNVFLQDLSESNVSGLICPQQQQAPPLPQQPCSMLRSRTMVHSNTSRSGTPIGVVNGLNGATATSSGSSSSVCTSTPVSTTPVKKSSRRNPWGSETYSDLISIAIRSYPDKQATLQQIYDFIVTHYEYFRERSDPTNSAGWKNSIRHNLSLHDRFTKCPKSSDNTKSSYWRINADVASKPYVRRRACTMDGANLKRSSSDQFGNPNASAKSSNRGPGHRSANSSVTAAINVQVPSTGQQLAKSSRSHHQHHHEHHINAIVTQASSTLCDMPNFNFHSSKMPCIIRSEPSSDSQGVVVGPPASISNQQQRFGSPRNGSMNKLLGFYPYNPVEQNNLMDDLWQSSGKHAMTLGSSHLYHTNNNNNNNNNPHHPNSNTTNTNNDDDNKNCNDGTTDNANNRPNLFNSYSPFTSIHNSTDQAHFRGRTSGLIEQLLRSDTQQHQHQHHHHHHQGTESHNSKHHQSPPNVLVNNQPFQDSHWFGSNPSLFMAAPPPNKLFNQMHANTDFMSSPHHVQPAPLPPPPHHQHQPTHMHHHHQQQQQQHLVLPAHHAHPQQPNHHHHHHQQQQQQQQQFDGCLPDHSRLQSANSGQHLFPVPIMLNSDSNGGGAASNASSVESGSFLANLSQSQWQSYRSSSLLPQQQQQEHHSQAVRADAYPTDGFMVSSGHHHHQAPQQQQQQQHSILNHSVYGLASDTCQMNREGHDGVGDDEKLLPFFAPTTSSSGLDMRLMTANTTATTLPSETSKHSNYQQPSNKMKNNDADDDEDVIDGGTTNESLFLTKQVTSPHTIYYSKTAAMLSLANGFDTNQPTSTDCGVQMSTTSASSCTTADSGISLANPTEDDDEPRDELKAGQEHKMDDSVDGDGDGDGSKQKSNVFRCTYSNFIESNLNDDDCEPLELELSLELADRIVGGGGQSGVDDSRTQDTSNHSCSSE